MGDDGKFVIEVWGDLACFTRPEMKVERFSYPVMTPSAARGILDAIYCKPIEFGWRIDRIEILKPIRYIALRRNEVKEKINVNALRAPMSRGGEVTPIVADATRDMVGSDQQGRTQRQTMALVDVHYRIHAHMQPRAEFAGNLKVLTQQMQRRLESGKCFCQPYFGCREFAAFFCQAEMTNAQPAQPINLDLGFMLYDVFNLNEVRSDGYATPQISVFRANVKNGVLDIPAYESDLVLKPA
ncbi:MAG: type I-C CRISPR-associated protein Cas5c [Bacillota bacterium]